METFTGSPGEMYVKLVNPTVGAASGTIAEGAELRLRTSDHPSRTSMAADRIQHIVRKQVFLRTGNNISAVPVEYPVSA